MKLDVFGREQEVVRVKETWVAYYLGNERKKRLAQDISIPEDIMKSEIVNYIADLCHEWATPRNSKVTIQ